jgi:beta-glucosidase/6-phospho-beta-glucosidase/beta-galactosidase
MLARHGIRTVRDGVRWHLIETSPGRYDWSSFLPMLRAARDTGTQVIWDIAHYGWPDDLDIFGPAFVDRFARFAGALARVVREETDEVPFYTPVNEISFWAWAAGETAYFFPSARGRGNELKAILVRASIGAVDAIRAVEPRARIVHAEPVINLVPKSEDEAAIKAARDYTLAQFEAFDMLSGRLRPELGGRPDLIDVIGVNYYLHNQWMDGDLPIAVDHPRYRPFRSLLADVHDRYGRPIFVAETGIEGEMRPVWLRVVAAEVEAAQAQGVPVDGLCFYPILDYPGWDDDRHCPTGLFGYLDEKGGRPLYGPLADEIARQRRRTRDTVPARAAGPGSPKSTEPRVPAAARLRGRPRG